MQVITEPPAAEPSIHEELQLERTPTGLMLRIGDACTKFGAVSLRTIGTIFLQVADDIEADTARNRPSNMAPGHAIPNGRRRGRSLKLVSPVAPLT